MTTAKLSIECLATCPLLRLLVESRTDLEAFASAGYEEWHSEGNQIARRAIELLDELGILALASAVDPSSEKGGISS